MRDRPTGRTLASQPKSSWNGIEWDIRSRANQSGLEGLYRMWYLHRATPIAAAPITVPGCPPLYYAGSATEHKPDRDDGAHLLAEICSKTPDGVEDEHLVLCLASFGRHFGLFVKPASVTGDSLCSCDRRSHRALNKRYEVAGMNDWVWGDGKSEGMSSGRASSLYASI